MLSDIYIKTLNSSMFSLTKTCSVIYFYIKPVTNFMDYKLRQTTEILKKVGASDSSRYQTKISKECSASELWVFRSFTRIP